LTSPAPAESPGALIGAFLSERAAAAGDVFFMKADGKLPGTEPFVKRFPEFCLDVGIAEQNGMSIAAGIASEGRTVYVWNTCTFLVYRPYDQIRWDVAYSGAKIRLIGTSAGYVNARAGMAAVSIEDIGALRSMPNLTIVCPGDLLEMKALLAQCHELPGPTFMRLGVERDALPILHRPEQTIRLGSAAMAREGHQAALLATGHVLREACEIVEDLRGEGIIVRLVSMHTLKPFDAAAVASIAAEGLPILTMEEHNIIGGLGSAAAEALAESGHGVPFRRCGFPDRYTTVSGDVAFLRAVAGYPDADDVKDWFRRHALR
jgi:transketolase